MKLRKRGSSFSSSCYEQLEHRNLLATFNGTDGADEVVVRFIDGTPQEVEINGVLHTTTDQAVHLALGEGEDRITFENVIINGRISTSGSVLSGAVNDVLTFNNRSDTIVVNSSGADDYWLVDETADDSDFEFQGVIEINTGDGNDEVEIHADRAVIGSLGDGDDRITISQDGVLTGVDGDAGFDVIDFDGVNAHLSVFSFGDDNRIAFGHSDGPIKGQVVSYSSNGFERVLAENPNDGFTNTIDYELLTDGFNEPTPFADPTKQLEFTVAGRFSQLRVNLEDGNVGPDVRLVNFDEFRAASFSSGIGIPFELSNSKVNVFATEFELDIFSQGVNIGHAGNWRAGDTSNILNDVTLRVLDYFDVSDINGEAHSVWLRQESTSSPLRLSGIAPADIHVHRGSFVHRAADWRIHGSDTGDDSFAISDARGRVVLFGHGGDDSFTIGSVHNDLTRVSAADFDFRETFTINVLGGEGFDRVHIRDNNSNVETGYSVHDNWLHPTGIARDWYFAGIWVDDIEVMNFYSNANPNQFFVDANKEIQYIFHSGQSDSEQGDSIFLSNFASLDPYFITGPGELRTWWFGGDDDDFKPIRFFNFELIQGE